MSFEPVDARLLYSRGDVNDPRLGERARRLVDFNTAACGESSLQSALAACREGLTYVVAGYPDDDGIRINGGRVGAALAPDSVRKAFYKMTPPLFAQVRGECDFIDLGNLRVGAPQFATLASRHAEASRFSRLALNVGAKWIAIGGGHDYGFPDAAAFIGWAEAAGHRPLILNFDAHLDVRPVVDGSGPSSDASFGGLSSGTPFFRMLEAFPNVDFAEIGIQGHCNSRRHLSWATERGARVLTQEEIAGSGESFATHVMRLLGDWVLKPRPVFLSIDIDGFSSAIAPGCSQSWATGFGATDFFPCLDILRSRLDIRSIGIYEVSPPLDADDRTSKLAAQILHRVVAYD